MLEIIASESIPIPLKVFRCLASKRIRCSALTRLCELPLSVFFIRISRCKGSELERGTVCVSLDSYSAE